MSDNTRTCSVPQRWHGNPKNLLKIPLCTERQYHTEQQRQYFPPPTSPSPNPHTAYSPGYSVDPGERLQVDDASVEARAAVVELLEAGSSSDRDGEEGGTKQQRQDGSRLSQGHGGQWHGVK